MHYALVLILTGAVSVTASPLIFKAQKTVASDAQTAIGSFDASKYKSIRIAVIAEDRTELPLAGSTAPSVRFAEGQVRRIRTKVEDGNASPMDYYGAEAALETAEEMARQKTDSLFPPIAVYTVDGNDEILLESHSFLPAGSKSFVIENPPPSITIKVYGKGKYKLYVWAM